MSEAKHTPGPWAYTDEGDGNYMVTADTPGDGRGGRWSLVADVAANKDGSAEVKRTEAEANARLIAAAPDLLAELQALVARNFGQPHGVTVPALDKARALIARATGH